MNNIDLRLIRKLSVIYAKFMEIKCVGSRGNHVIQGMLNFSVNMYVNAKHVTFRYL